MKKISLYSVSSLIVAMAFGSCGTKGGETSDADIVRIDSGNVVDSIMEPQKEILTTPDLSILALRGPVHKCFVENGEVVYVFDKEGNLTNAEQVLGKKIFRDKQGRIIKHGSGEPNDMDGEVYYDEVTWTDDNRVKTYASNDSEGGTTKTFFYTEPSADMPSVVEQEKIKAWGWCYGGTITYTDYEIDEYGNWTKRKAHKKLRCDEDGGEELNNIETESRRIEYYESLSH